MKRISNLILACLMLCFTAVGCAVNVSGNAESETDMGSHHVTVRPGSVKTMSMSMTLNDLKFYEYACGDVKIKIKADVLTVNNQNYGKLEPGQSIEVDHGKVLVDGQERQSLFTEEPHEPGPPSTDKATEDTASDADKKTEQPIQAEKSEAQQQPDKQEK